MKDLSERQIIFLNLNFQDILVLDKIITSYLPQGRREENMVEYIHEMLQKKIKDLEQ